MKLAGHDIGVCSWSLQPHDLGDLASLVRQLGLSHTQLALVPLLSLTDDQRARELAQLKDAGIQLTGGMAHFPGEDYSTIAMIRDTGGFMPNGMWTQRREACAGAARLAKSLGVSGITSHVGFVPPSNDGQYRTAIERVREVARIFAEHGQTLYMETGQERAHELLQFLNDLAMKNVGINFDPANMILYGAGDPIEAIQTLGRHIRHVHVKDATLSTQPGILWGEEVPFGTGQVPVKDFLAALQDAGYTGALAIEREAGNQRLEDVRTAIDVLREALA